MFFGPCCDYSAAPLARQLSYWNIPMVTPGAMASDFGNLKKSLYPYVTRVGTTLNTLSEAMLSIFNFYNFTHIKLIYEPGGFEHITFRLCHFVTESIYFALNEHGNMTHDNFKFQKWEDAANAMPDEVGKEYSGKHRCCEPCHTCKQTTENIRENEVECTQSYLFGCGYCISQGHDCFFIRFVFYNRPH